MITIGIDNGQSGSIGIIAPGRVQFLKVPSVPYLHYGKKGTINRRLDRKAFDTILKEATGAFTQDVNYDDLRVVIERPVSMQYLNSTLPAHRFFEATIICFEDFDHGHGLGYEVVDSKLWQQAMLGDVTGKMLKKASKLRALQLYPQLKDAIYAHEDADGLLIAHFYHNTFQQK